MYNRKAQLGQLGLSILIGLMVFMIGSLFISPLMTTIGEVRTGLSCSSPSTISDGTKLLCLIFDATIPYIILSIVSIAGGMVLSKFLL